MKIKGGRVTKVNIATGEVLYEVTDSYELRRPKGLSPHAPLRRFAKGKPRYRRDASGLLVMAMKRV